MTVVEHVEGADAARFALRLGRAATNENRIELRAANEAAKVEQYKEKFSTKSDTASML